MRLRIGVTPWIRKTWIMGMLYTKTVVRLLQRRGLVLNVDPSERVEYGWAGAPSGFYDLHNLSILSSKQVLRTSSSGCYHVRSKALTVELM